MARPTKLTPEIHNRIVNAIKAGNYMETAAAAAGINKSTLYKWLRDGERANRGIMKEFSNAVHMALAQSEMADVDVLRKAGWENGDWRASLARLQRRFPDRWGEKTHMTVAGDPEAPMKSTVEVKNKDFDLTNLTAEELEQMETLHLKALQGSKALEGLTPDIPESTVEGT